MERSLWPRCRAENFNLHQKFIFLNKKRDNEREKEVFFRKSFRRNFKIRPTFDSGNFRHRPIHVRIAKLNDHSFERINHECIEANYFNLQLQHGHSVSFLCNCFDFDQIVNCVECAVKRIQCVYHCRNFRTDIGGIKPAVTQIDCITNLMFSRSKIIIHELRLTLNNNSLDNGSHSFRDQF